MEANCRGFHADTIERTHLQFCKHLLGVKIQTQNNFIHGELGRVPLRNYLIMPIIRFWFQIVQSENTKYIKLTYNMMLDDLQKSPDKPSLAKSVRSLLECLGFNHVWLEQGVGDIYRFMCSFKQRLTDNLIQMWNEQIENSSRAKTYILITNFYFKIYLDFNTIRKNRYAFTRLRVSSHRLEIEAGRWHKPDKIPVLDKKCQLCISLGDEYHFILECPLYQDLHIAYIKRYFWVRPNMPKFYRSFTDRKKRL